MSIRTLLITGLALFPAFAYAQLNFGPDSTGAVIADVGEDGRASVAMSVLALGGGTSPDVLIAGRAEQQFAPAAALLRYTADGALDTDFGADGLVLTNFSDIAGVTLSVGTPVLVLDDDDGGLYVIATASAPDRIAILRYSQGGELDTAFGINGGAILDVSDGAAADRVAAAALDAAGRIVLVGRRDFAVERSRAAVWRVLPDGTPDDSFADDGVWSGPAAAVVSSDFNAVTLRDGNGIIAGGAAQQGTEVVFDRAGTLRGDFIVQLDSAGEPVADFGENGEVYILGQFDEADVVNAVIYALALRGDMIIYSGTANYGAGADGPGSLGVIDADTGATNDEPGVLGGQSRVQLLPGGQFAQGRDIAVLGNGDIAVVGAGQTGADTGTSLLITRFGNDQDGDFVQLDDGQLYRDISPETASGGLAAVAYGDNAVGIALAGFAQNPNRTNRMMVSRTFFEPPPDDGGNGNGGNGAGPGDGGPNPIGGGGSGSAVGGGALGGLGLVLLGLLGLGRLLFLRRTGG